VKILVLHPGALGDIILSLPALAALRQRFREAHITFAANLDFATAVAQGYADEMRSLSCLPLHRLYLRDTLPEQDLRFWQSYERIISWTGAGHEVFEDQLRALSPQSLIGRWKPAPGDARHVSQIFVDTLRSWLGTSDDPGKTRIFLDEAYRRAGTQWLQERGCTPGISPVAIHPGAGSPTKRWPLPRYQSLARQIVQRKGNAILLVEGPAERGTGRETAADLPPERVQIAASLPLGLLGGVLSCCQSLVGNDSGVAHLAAGLGIPSLVLFGPTSPRQWSPLGSHVLVLRDTTDCGACEHGAQPEHTCLKNLSVGDVYSSLGSLQRIGPTA